MTFHSQIGQDEFVIERMDGKLGGFFVDFGCADWRFINNTLTLERDYGWTGISIDKNPGPTTGWEGNRKTDGLICGDVFDMDITEVFAKHHAPQIIDYISLDLEPPRLTFELLARIPWEAYKFRVITFEHDGYRTENRFKEPSREFFRERGYEFVKPAGCQDNQEDWWVLP